MNSLISLGIPDIASRAEMMMSETGEYLFTGSPVIKLLIKDTKASP